METNISPFSQLSLKKESLEIKKIDLEDEISSEIQSYEDTIKNGGKIALMLGLGALILYVTIGFLFPNPKSKKNKSEFNDNGDSPVIIQHENETGSPIIKSIMNNISIFLLNIAKEKIITFLSELKSNYDKTVAKETSGETL